MYRGGSEIKKPFDPQPVGSMLLLEEAGNLTVSISGKPRTGSLVIPCGGLPVLELAGTAAVRDTQTILAFHCCGLVADCTRGRHDGGGGRGGHDLVCVCMCVCMASGAGGRLAAQIALFLLHALFPVYICCAGECL
jgi:hypothetical protein